MEKGSHTIQLPEQQTAWLRLLDIPPCSLFPPHLSDRSLSTVSQTIAKTVMSLTALFFLSACPPDVIADRLLVGTNRQDSTKHPKPDFEKGFSLKKLADNPKNLARALLTSTFADKLSGLVRLQASLFNNAHRETRNIFKKYCL